MGPPSLHQGMAPAFPPSLGGSLPSAYQFVRDPQSGQLVVIPSDHLPHFGKWRLRASCGGGGGRKGQGTHPTEPTAGSRGLREDLGRLPVVSTCDKPTGGLVISCFYLETMWRTKARPPWGGHGPPRRPHPSEPAPQGGVGGGVGSPQVGPAPPSAQRGGGRHRCSSLSVSPQRS